MKEVAFITSCTVSRNFPPLVRVRDIPPGNMEEAVAWWTEQLDKHAKDTDNLKTPGDIYKGIAYNTVFDVANTIGHDNVHIVTGGQGLIKLTTPIVPYDFTSDANEAENIHQNIKGEKFIPGIWWSKINTWRHGYGTPIAALLDEYEFIVGAMNKSFVKYLVKDLSSIPSDVLRKRVFIPIPRSMMSSFPKAIHEALIPYESSYTRGLNASRFDKPHKAAKKFLEAVLKGADPVALSATIAEEATSEAVARAKTSDAPDYDDMFERHPEILDTNSPEQALRVAKVLGERIGGRHRFTAAWRGAKGHVSVDVTDEQMTKAREALGSLIQEEEQVAQDDVILEQIGLFVKVLKDTSPATTFTTSMVAKWGEQMYGEDAPSGITSAVKLAYIMEYNAKYLGIETFKQGNKTIYKIRD